MSEKYILFERDPGFVMSRAETLNCDISSFKDDDT